MTRPGSGAAGPAQAGRTGATRSSASPDRLAELGHAVVHPQPERLEDDPPGQGVAVGVQAGGGQADQHVAGRDLARRRSRRSRSTTPDDEARQVVLALGVEARHLGGLAAEQRAAVRPAPARDARHDLLGDVRARAARWRGSPGRRAAWRPGRGCRSRSGSPGPRRPCRAGRPGRRPSAWCRRRRRWRRARARRTGRARAGTGRRTSRSPTGRRA